jgi:hypothetical protein
MNLARVSDRGVWCGSESMLQPKQDAEPVFYFGKVFGREDSPALD